MKAGASQLAQPRAIVIVSAHWDTAEPTVGFADTAGNHPRLLGFPGMSSIPCATRPPAAAKPRRTKSCGLPVAAGLPVASDTRRGLDHGAWVPLRLMFPEAECAGHSAFHPEPGRAATGLRGSARLWIPLTRARLSRDRLGQCLTHNLRDYQIAWRNGGQTPAYVRSSPTGWPSGCRLTTLTPCSTTAARHRAVVQAHPSEEHLLPSVVALGAGGEGRPEAQRLHAGIDDYVIAMDAYSFLPQ